MKTPVNEGMTATLESEPERFFYYNNGVTIVCDEAEQRRSEGRDYLVVGNPQVINGQQTTRVLAASPQQAAKASVLVKVIRVPRAEPDDMTAFEELVSRIVAGTNWQNAIKPSDLMSNDRKQIQLQRALRKVGYLYLRKRERKGEALALVGGKQFHVVWKEDFAQAVAGCDLDPAVNPSGKKKLFEEERYPQVFPNADPDFYLPRYRLLREVAYCARGVRDRVYAKWLVLHFVWSQLSPHVRGHRKSRAFRALCEAQDEGCVVPLSQAIDSVYVEALRYYRENRGQGDVTQDVVTFFKRRGHHKAFADYWHSVSPVRHEKFTRWLDQVSAAIASADQ
jgi:hypothetical protein